MTTKTTFNDLVQYINSGHPLDPVPVRQEREQLAAMLNDLGAKLMVGDSFEFEFSGKIVATISDGRVEVAIVGTNGNARSGDICNAILSLNGLSQETLRVCPGCENHFAGTRKYCCDSCARLIWNRNAKEKRQPVNGAVQVPAQVNENR